MTHQEVAIPGVLFGAVEHPVSRLICSDVTEVHCLDHMLETVS